MDTTTFIRRLKKAHSKLVVHKFPGRVWGLALRMPRHPEANEHGYVQLPSMTSPAWYGSTQMPDKTLVSAEGQIQVRSWKTILRLLVGQGHLERSKVNSLFGGCSWEIERA